MMRPARGSPRRGWLRQNRRLSDAMDDVLRNDDRLYPFERRDLIHQIQHDFLKNGAKRTGTGLHGAGAVRNGLDGGIGELQLDML